MARYPSPTQGAPACHPHPHPLGSAGKDGTRASVLGLGGAHTGLWCQVADGRPPTVPAGMEEHRDPPPRPLGLPRGHIVGQSEGRCRHTDRRHHSAGREGNTRLLPSPRAGRRRSSSPHGPATHPREVVPSGATAATGQSQGRGRQRSAPPGGTGRGRGRGRGGGGGRGVADTLQGSVC